MAHTFHGKIVTLIILISTVPRFHKKLRKYNSKRRGKKSSWKDNKINKNFLRATDRPTPIDY